ncbi:MAG: hypothetical protein KC455_11765 [Carnobacterium sp.]|nr:hypothetical protein [Carnobacterium sp.]
MDVVFLIIVVVFAIIVIPIAKKMSKSEDTKNERTIFQEELDKYANHKKYSLFYNDVIIFNSSNSKIAHIITDQNYYFRTEHLNTKDIVEVALIIDGESITTTSRGSQLGGAFVGGALFGGAGAVVGGLSGEKSTRQNISQIYIKLTLLSEGNSIKKFILLDVKNPIEKSSAQFKKIYEEAMELEGRLKTIIHQQNKEKNLNKTIINPTNIADEIEKLHNLLIKDILTEEEFTLQKERLLSK